MNKAFRAGLSIGLAIITLGFITVAAQAAGTSNCQVIYGGGESCNPEIKFTLDKKVQKPTKGGEMVDNLSINDEKFISGQDVVFKITIHNTGNQNITLTVVDTLPQYVDFISGGTYDNDKRTVNNTIELNPDQKKDINIVTRVVSNEKLAQDKTITCVTNIVRGTGNNGATADDASQFCIEKRVVAKPTPQVFEATPVKKIPETGPEMLPLLGLIPAGIAGFAMRRKFKLS